MIKKNPLLFIILVVLTDIRETHPLSQNLLAMGALNGKLLSLQI